MFKQVEQTPRYKLVAEQIAELIISGKLLRGKKMPPDRELVSELGVSRATIREAMIALEISGFIENRFGSGAYVSQSPPSSPKLTNEITPGPFELLEARMVIEGEIAAIAAQFATKKDIAHLEYCISCMLEENEERFWSRNADEEFHVSIARLPQNTSFVNIVSEFWRHRTKMPMWVQMRDHINVNGWRSGLAEEHMVIVEALAAGDPEASRQAMRNHISSFGRALLERWNNLEENMRADINPPDDRMVKQLAQ